VLRYEWCISSTTFAIIHLHVSRMRLALQKYPKHSINEIMLRAHAAAGRA
jgi:hypothetical protein